MTLNSPHIPIKKKEGHGQWTFNGEGYMPIGETVKRLRAGVYMLDQDPVGNTIWVPLELKGDDIVDFPDSTSDKVIKSISKFWKTEHLFAKRGQLFKRGILLYGPPGSGKTVTLTRIMKALVEDDGIVLMCNTPSWAGMAMKRLRMVEPDRKIICVMEDIDGIVSNPNNEQFLLQLLDGELQIDGIVYLATTNYIDKLAARFRNRPSRFDEVILLDMPNDTARKTYLRAKIGECEVNDETLAEWVRQTEGMSVAHLREVIVSVFCLGRSFEETIERLRGMEVDARDRAKAAGVAVADDDDEDE